MRHIMLEFLGVLFYNSERFINLCKSAYLSSKFSGGGKSGYRGWRYCVTFGKYCDR